MSRRLVLLGPYPPPYGGVSIYISTLFKLLKNHGAELWTYGDQRISEPGVFFLKDRRRQLPWLLVRRGRGAHIADSTHFLVEHPSLLVPVWVTLKAILGFEWIKIVHDGSLPSRYERFSNLRRALFRLSIRRVTRFIVVSDELRRWLHDEILVAQKITVIKSLLPVNDLEAEHSLPAATEPDLASYLRRAKRVCSIGVFIPDYGFDQAAQGVEQLRRTTGEDIGLILLDGGFAEDESYRAEVLRGRDWITELKNVVHGDVFKILKVSHAFVRAFAFESYGLSRVEALWCGIPVVATRAGETRGMLLYDFGDTEQLVAQLQRALFEKPVEDIKSWAAQYTREAEANLHLLKEELGLTED